MAFGPRGPIELATLIRALRAGGRAVAVAMVGGLVVGLGATSLLPRSYDAAATVRVDPFVVDQLTQSGRNTNFSADGLSIEARSDAVLSAAAARLDPTITVPELRSLLSVSQNGDDPLIQIVARTGDPARAADIANAVAAAILEVRANRIETDLAATDETLRAQIDAARAQLAALDTQLALSSDPELLITRDQLAQRLDLLIEVEVRAESGDGAPVRRTAAEIETVKAELVALDRLLAERVDPGLVVERNALAEQLDLLNEFQVRSQLNQALPGEVLRAAVPADAPAGTSALVNGLALAVLAGGCTLAVFAFRQRALITRGDVEALFGQVLAELPAGERSGLVGTTPGAGVPAAGELGRIDLWLWVNGARAPLFVSSGASPVASILARELGRYRSGYTTTQVIDFENRLPFDTSPSSGITVVHPSAMAGAHSEVLNQDLLMVAPPVMVEPVALEAALAADAVVLVVDEGSARYHDVVRSLEKFRILGVVVSGAVVVAGNTW